MQPGAAQSLLSAWLEPLARRAECRDSDHHEVPSLKAMAKPMAPDPVGTHGGSLSLG